MKSCNKRNASVFKIIHIRLWRELHAATNSSHSLAKRLSVDLFSQKCLTSKLKVVFAPTNTLETNQRS